MSEKLKVERSDIVERSVSYSLRVIELVRQLERNDAGRVLGKQLLRSGTSIGANVHEAQGGQSRADFISKMTIAYKEVRESLYWIRLIQAAKLGSAQRIDELFDETQQLVKILSAILLTSKKRSLQEAVS